jgi:hypothetical protein
MGRSPVGMDDFWAFVHFKQKEFYSVEGRDYFKGLEEANLVLKKITGASTCSYISSMNGHTKYSYFSKKYFNN